jgi:hypothetical protein
VKAAKRIGMAGAMAMAVLLMSCQDQTTSAGSGQNFQHRIRPKSEGMFSGFHGNERTTLVIDDNKFSAVCGSSPYYLRIPGTNAIFFQTKETMHGSYHINFFDTRAYVSVRADSGIPGGAIGLVGRDNHKVWIQSFSNNVLVVGNRFLEVQCHHYIDLNQRKVTKNDVWIFDQEKGGRITNHIIYEASKT